MTEKTITTEEIKRMIAEGADNLYVRYSSGPAVDRDGTSKDYAAGQPHAEYTLSANPLVPQERVDEHDDFGYWIGTDWVTNWSLYRALGEETVLKRLREYSYLPGRAWVMRAERVGTDSDNAALIDSRSFEFLGWWEDERE